MVRDIGSEPDHLPLDYGKLLLVLLGAVALVFFCAWLMHHVVIANMVLMTVTLVVVIFFFREAFKLDRIHRNKMYVAFVLMLEAVVFYVLYAQMPTSLNFFAINNMHHEMLGFTVNPISFQALNPFWVVVGSPVLAMIYTRMGSQGRDLTMPPAYPGHVLLLLWLPDRGGGGHLVCRCRRADLALVHGAHLPVPEPGRADDQRPGAGHGGGAGAAAVDGLHPGDVVPDPGDGIPAGGYVATFTAVPQGVTDPLLTLPIYTDVFGKIGLATLLVAVVMALMVPWLNRMMNAGPADEEDVLPQQAKA